MLLVCKVYLGLAGLGTGDRKKENGKEICLDLSPHLPTHILWSCRTISTGLVEAAYSTPASPGAVMDGEQRGLTISSCVCSQVL